ncbi:MAG: hypothetical protein OXG44_20375 [Gammaproteobacteria bacterium]|nr:hypothetical protein [Gammaproteobacteria bacterium]
MGQLTAQKFVQTLRDAGIDLDTILARLLAGAVQSDQQLTDVGRVGGLIEGDEGYEPNAGSGDDSGSDSEEESEDTDEATASAEADSGGES